MSPNVYTSVSTSGIGRNHHNNVINSDPPRSARRSGSLAPLNTICDSKSQRIARWAGYHGVGRTRFAAGFRDTEQALIKGEGATTIQRI